MAASTNRTSSALEGSTNGEIKRKSERRVHV